MNLALDRHQARYLTDLARIAKRDGYSIVHTTLAEIKKGTYRSRPSRQTLDALAHLAGVSYEAAREAAGLGPSAPPFARELPEDVDLLTPRERQALIQLMRVMLDNHRSDGGRRETGVLGVTDADLHPPSE